MGGGTFVNKLFQKIKQAMELKNSDSNKRMNKLSYVIIIGLIGLFLLLVSNIFSSPKEEQAIPQQPVISGEESEEASGDKKEDREIKHELEESYENDLEQMIEKIQGVEDVEVMVNLDSTNVKVYEKNIIKGTQTTDETDTNGGQRKVEDDTEETEVVLVRQGEQEVPLLVQTKKPDVRGVFIVASGVEEGTVKMWVLESVAKVLDVSPHKISVMPK